MNIIDLNDNKIVAKMEFESERTLLESIDQYMIIVDGNSGIYIVDTSGY